MLEHSPQADLAPVVLVTWPDYEPAGTGTGARLQAAGCVVRLAPKRGARSTSELVALVSDVAAAIVSTDPFDDAVLEAAASLRVIARVGVGVDSIDLASATRRGVAVCTTHGTNATTTAEHAVALMLAALRRVPEHDAAVRRGRWPRTGADAPWELTGRTVGIVGYGEIGRLVARRLSGFDVTVLATDPQPARDGGVELVGLAELLARSHVVSLHAPLTDATRGLIGRDEIAAMRGDAVLVNTARGGLVDEGALADALAARRLRAAALDVFADEPPRNRRLLELPNLVLTPHTGGVSTRSVGEMLERATADVVDVLAGRVPAGLVNPTALATGARR